MARLVLALMASFLSLAHPSQALPPDAETTWMKMHVVSLALDSISIDGSRPQHFQRVEAVRRGCGEGEDRDIQLWSQNTVVPMMDGWVVKSMAGMPWLLPGDELLVSVIPMEFGREGFYIKEAWLVDGGSGCDGAAVVRDISRYEAGAASMALNRADDALTYLEATMFYPREPLETGMTVHDVETGSTVLLRRH